MFTDDGFSLILGFTKILCSPEKPLVGAPDWQQNHIKAKIGMVREPECFIKNLNDRKISTQTMDRQIT